MGKARQIDFLLIGYRYPDTDTPVSQGEAYFYKDGTSTLATIWLDRDKTNQASNPVTLDDQGRAEVFGDDIYQVDIHEPRISTTQKGALIESMPGLFVQEGVTYYIDPDTEDIGNLTVETINTGHGANEVYPMDQAVKETSNVKFKNIEITEELVVNELLKVLSSAIISGSVDLQSALTVAGFLQLNNDMDATGNIDADGFTINGSPVGTSSDTYWNSDGSGNIYYRSGNVLGNPITLNKDIIDSNWEIPSGYNGVSVGPLEINAKITLNGRWEVL